MDSTKFCQSCGMPLTKDVLGTNADKSLNEEYCSYCYKDGKFTAENITMDAMIEACIEPMVAANKDMTRETAKKMMQEFFPTLKRWAK